MAEKRCPMCGKSNPDHLDECQNCGARLKPLLPSSGESTQPEPVDQTASSGDSGSSDGDWMQSLREGDEYADNESLEDSDDWLSDLRSGENFEDTGDEDLGEVDGALPDWMSSSVFEEAGSEEGQGGGENLVSEEGEKDWLGMFGQEADAEDSFSFEHAQAATSKGDDLPDWLKFPGEEETPESNMFSETGEEVEHELDIFASDEEDSGSETGDWIDDLGESKGEEDSLSFEHAQSASAQSDDLPDWLKLPGEEDEGVQEPELPDFGAAEEESPDWLQGLGAVTGEGDVPDFGIEPADAETPDWLSDGGSETPEETIPEYGAAEDESPDWLQELGAVASEEEVPDFGIEPTDAETPDWLSGGESDTPEETIPEFGAAEEESPDWLQELGAVTGEEEVQDIGVVPADTETPDWLASAESEMPETAFSDIGTPEEKSPDWLQGLGAMGGEEESAELAPSGEEVSQDWLTGLGDESISEGIGDLASGEDQEQQPDWLRSFEKDLPGAPQTGDLEWLTDMASESPESADLDWLENGGAGGESAPDIQITPVEGEPDWLADLGGGGIEESSPALAGDISQDLGSMDDLEMAEGDLPDWLAEVGSESFGDSVEEPLTEDSTGWGTQAAAAVYEDISGEEETPGDLAPGELPEWLEAMRPDEGEDVDVLTRATTGDEEKMGPLAGFKGLLRAMPDAAKVIPPPEYSAHLEVNETQKNYTALLRSIVEMENEPRPKRDELVSSPQRILRWLIALGLFLAVSLPIIASSELTPLPDSLPPETEAFREAINNVNSGAPVLVAFDYNPAFSGELDAAASAAIDHLITLKGARLALVSTSPTGPALGERFIQETQGHHNYIAGQQYVNLGFIAGGITGLQNFALSPQKTTPVAFDNNSILQYITNPAGLNPWETPVLNGVFSLGDFELTIVMTDDPETARSWVEQVEPALKPNSLTMVISAQAEPMIRPYYEQADPQIQGLITGLTGGAAYEGFLRSPNKAWKYWDAFGMGIFMTMLLILVGGIYNLIQSVSGSQKRQTREKIS